MVDVKPIYTSINIYFSRTSMKHLYYTIDYLFLDNIFDLNVHYKISALVTMLAKYCLEIPIEVIRRWQLL